MKKCVFFFVVVVASLSSCTKEYIDVTEDWVNYTKSTSSSSPNQTEVYSYRPAPGQFINKTEFATETLAIEHVKEQWNSQTPAFISLGGFGGYVIVGFDHSIPSAKALGNVDQKYDFFVKGNPTNSSSEPGIVYVMQDANGNGEPDDTWYELKGSEHGVATIIKDYAVTYTKPAADNSLVEWSDNQEQSGEIDYMGAFHSQRTYYPTWINEENYTLSGVRLQSNTSQSASGSWTNMNYQWGYADNFGSDLDVNHGNGFRIRNAVDENGADANLQFIDFIKVQTGVNSKAGSLGEVSTEVYGFTDAYLL